MNTSSHPRIITTVTFCIIPSLTQQRFQPIEIVQSLAPVTIGWDIRQG